jgi:hypothetical protein
VKVRFSVKHKLGSNRGYESTEVKIDALCEVHVSDFVITFREVSKKHVFLDEEDAADKVIREVEEIVKKLEEKSAKFRENLEKLIRTLKLVGTVEEEIVYL